jgi:hypothetical protein
MPTSCLAAVTCGVERIAESLRAAGHDPWVDKEEILVGDSIPRAVERGLRAADFVIVCLSTAAAERGWVDAERNATMMQQFRERKGRILPVRLEPVDPPYLIAQLAYVDLFPGDDAFRRGIERLARSISARSEFFRATRRPSRWSRSPPMGATSRSAEGMTPKRTVCRTKTAPCGSTQRPRRAS